MGRVRLVRSRAPRLPREITAQKRLRANGDFGALRRDAACATASRKIDYELTPDC
jgi:hypothetical protein